MGIRFSIIIPVYNVEKYLTKCIEGVFMQTYTDYEVLLVDDGSTDSSSSICDNLADNSRKIRVIHQKNQGLSAARNTGIDNAIGEYLIFLDSDDYWDDENALREINQIIDKKNVEVVTWSLKKYIEDTGEIETKHKQFAPLYKNGKTEIVKALLQNSLYRACACDKAVKRSLITENSLYFKLGDTSEDIEWAAELMICMKSIEILPKDFYVYRQRKGSITKTKSQKNINDLIRHIEKCIRFGEAISDKLFKEVYWGYVSEQYTNMLIVFSIEKIMKENIGEVQKNKWILKYGYSTRTKICHIVSRVVGIKGTIMLLKVFLKLV